MLGLYIHIPFCSAICNYCNFNRGLFHADLKGRYVAALEREIRSTGRGEPADTIYFGGGTPSLLEPTEIGQVITACRASFRITANAEITLETNPETSSGPRMEQFRAAGVNRLSFGVQSFHDEELKRLGRIHSAQRARAAVKEARGAGFDNISLDLMMWLPQQTLADWKTNVESLIDVGPEHASLYLLELYPNAPLKEDMARSGWSMAPDDDAAEMYLWSLARLELAGYRQYEISNVARPGLESRHNLKYWQDGEWLGFGCGAHSTRSEQAHSTRSARSGQADRSCVRWKNVASTEDYISRVAGGLPLAVETRSMSAKERMEDALFTGLRLVEGVDMNAVSSRYGIDVWGRYWDRLQPFLDARVLCRDGSRLSLSRDGMLIANEVMQVFV